MKGASEMRKQFMMTEGREKRKENKNIRGIRRRKEEELEERTDMQKKGKKEGRRR